MGIPYLNKLVMTKCRRAVSSLSFADLAGKTIAIDMSIYLYQFLCQPEKDLITHIQSWIQIFQKHQIDPLFVFDGKPPTEKNACLQRRFQEKEKAYLECQEIKKKMETLQDTTDDMIRNKLQTSLHAWKKKCIRIRKRDIDEVKDLFSKTNIPFVDAPGEADAWCSHMVIQGHVWACLSEDMDLFVYGCPRVLRSLNIKDEKVMIYDLHKILKCLQVSQKEFREICVLSGTDYTPHLSLMDIFELHKKWISSKCNQHWRAKERDIGFYDWVLKNTNTQYIQDYSLLIKTVSMFDLSFYHVFDFSFENFPKLDSWYPTTLLPLSSSS